MDKSREQFETWFDYVTHGMDEEHYEAMKVILFTSWQASRAAIEIELPSTQYYGDHWSGDWALDEELVRDSIEEQGLKVKE